MVKFKLKDKIYIPEEYINDSQSNENQELYKERSKYIHQLMLLLLTLCTINFLTIFNLPEIALFDSSSVFSTPLFNIEIKLPEFILFSLFLITINVMFLINQTLKLQELYVNSRVPLKWIFTFNSNSLFAILVTTLFIFLYPSFIYVMSYWNISPHEYFIPAFLLANIGVFALLYTVSILAFPRLSKPKHYHFLTAILIVFNILNYLNPEFYLRRTVNLSGLQKLERIDFTNTHLKNANLYNFSCRNCNFRGVSFLDASLKNTDFWGSDLSYTNFSNNNLVNVNFVNTDLSNAQFVGTIINTSTEVHSSILTGSNFLNSKIQGAGFTEVDLRNVLNFPYHELCNTRHKRDIIFPENISITCSN